MTTILFRLRLAALWVSIAAGLLGFGTRTAYSQASITGAFSPGASTSISVSTTSSNVSLSGIGPVALVYNSGANTAYVAVGATSATVATTSSMPIPAGMLVSLQIPAPGYVAAITASSTTTLLVTQGTGGPNVAFGSLTTTPSGTQNVNIVSPLGQGLMAASVSVAIASNQSAIPASQSGTWTVTPTVPIGITPTDRTVTSASGSSQQVMAANASRHNLLLVNTGSANCGVNPTGGTAVIGGAGTLTLVPNGSYQPRVPTLSAVTAICTAAQPLYAEEN